MRVSREGLPVELYSFRDILAYPFYWVFAARAAATTIGLRADLTTTAGTPPRLLRANLAMAAIRSAAVSRDA